MCGRVNDFKISYKSLSSYPSMDISSGRSSKVPMLPNPSLPNVLFLQLEG